MALPEKASFPRMVARTWQNYDLFGIKELFLKHMKMLTVRIRLEGRHVEGIGSITVWAYKGILDEETEASPNKPEQRG